MSVRKPDALSEYAGRSWTAAVDVSVWSYTCSSVLWVPMRNGRSTTGACCLPPAGFGGAIVGAVTASPFLDNRYSALPRMVGLRTDNCHYPSASTEVEPRVILQ